MKGLSTADRQKKIVNDRKIRIGKCQDTAQNLNPNEKLEVRNERSRSRSPMLIKSPIITSSNRRGLLETNWADVTIGSELVISSGGNSSCRKPRKVRRKKKSMTGLQSDVSLSESFQASLCGNIHEGSFQMDRESDRGFSGSARGSPPNGNATGDTPNNSHAYECAVVGERGFYLGNKSPTKSTEFCPVLEGIAGVV